MSSTLALSKIVHKYKCDIVLVCEHKLFEHSLSFLDSIDNNFASFAKADNSLDNYSRARCGKAGVAVLYKRYLKGITVTPLNQIGNDRVIGVEIKGVLNVALYVFCAYMPADGNIIRYREQLELLYDLHQYYSAIGRVIIAGDMNSSCIDNFKCNKYKSTQFVNFLKETNLTPVNTQDWCKGPMYTFTPCQSMIDYVLVDSLILNSITRCEIIGEDVCEVTSDHLPIVWTIRGGYTQHYQQQSSQHTSIAWHKATPTMLLSYSIHVDEAMALIENTHIGDSVNVNKLTHELTESLRAAAYKALPVTKFNPHTKPYWTPEVKHAHAQSRSKRRAWIADGRPRGREFTSYTNYKQAKRSFINAQQEASEEYINKAYRDIDEAAGCDIRLFWKLISKRKKKCPNRCEGLTINHKTYEAPNDIAEAFGSYFECLFSPDDNDLRFDDAFKQTVEQEVTLIKQRSKTFKTHNAENITPITIDEIKVAIKSLKRRKAPGHDTITNEHVIHGGQRLIRVICKLFCAIQKNENVPKCWRKSLIIPIHKGGGKSKTDPDNYRAISLLPIFYKLYEQILTKRVKDRLLVTAPDFPNKQQHGFRPGLSCITAAFQVQETILYNLELGANIYAAFLDTRKAFDTVWHEGLFLKMHRLGINGSLWQIIVNMYEGLESAVLVNNVHSNWFPIGQGVKQGGVLSTLLYLIYINDLIEHLATSGLGAKIMSIECGCPTLADDLTCLATSPKDLNGMLELVNSFSKKWRYTINSSKSRVIVFSRSRKRRHKYKDSWRIGSSIIEESDNINHLGIRRASKGASTERTTHACRKGRGAFHALSNIGVRPRGLNPKTSVSLYTRVVLPSVLYGCELWNDLLGKDIRALNVFQHYVTKKIQGFPRQTRSDMCESMLGLLPIETAIDKTKLKFFHKLLNMDPQMIPKQIFIRRLNMIARCQPIVQTGFSADIVNILKKYGLLQIIQPILKYMNTCNLPTKNQWKKTINQTIDNHAHAARIERMHAVTDFRRFSELHPNNQIAHIWTIPRTTNELFMVDFVASLWVHPILEHPSVCQHCEMLYVDIIQHIVTLCPLTHHITDQFINTTDNIYGTKLGTYEQFTCLLAILNPKHLIDPSEKDNALAMTCVRFLYDICNSYSKHHP